MVVTILKVGNILVDYVYLGGDVDVNEVNRVLSGNVFRYLT